VDLATGMKYVGLGPEELEGAELVLPPAYLDRCGRVLTGGGRIRSAYGSSAVVRVPGGALVWAPGMGGSPAPSPDTALVGGGGGGPIAEARSV
jgi:hypothetical protein